MLSTELTTFLASREYTQATAKTYQYALTRLFCWLEERGQTLDQLTLEVYCAFVREHNWSNNMRRVYGSALRAFLQWRSGGRRDHPIFSLRLPRDNALPGRALDETGLHKLLASFDTTTPLGWRNLAIVSLMVETGLRAVELCRLEMSRLDMTNRSLVVLAKREKPREGVFGEDTARFLDIWLSERGKYARKGVRAVFVSLAGRSPGYGLTPSGLRCIYHTFGERAGVGHISPHDMRRTMAMLLTESGAPTRLVQLLGAWDDIRMVERYTRRLKPGQIDRFSPVRAATASIQFCCPTGTGSKG